MVNKQVYDHSNEHNLLCGEQHGFRLNQSIHSAINGQIQELGVNGYLKAKNCKRSDCFQTFYIVYVYCLLAIAAWENTNVEN